jgi:hypothetical protein
METKNLTKSFGIRVPLDMYLKMIEVGAENKISITDICLYSLANSGILKSNFSFKFGGEVNTDQIKKLQEQNAQIKRSFDQLQLEHETLKKGIDERVKKEVGGYEQKISNMGVQRDMLREEIRLLRMSPEFRKGN